MVSASRRVCTGENSLPAMPTTTIETGESEPGAGAGAEAEAGVGEVEEASAIFVQFMSSTSTGGVDLSRRKKVLEELEELDAPRGALEWTIPPVKNALTRPLGRSKIYVVRAQ